MKIIMICGAARCGKDTILPIIRGEVENKYGGNWERYAFADKLKSDCEEKIQEIFGVSVWNDSKKHLFRDYLIEYGQRKRHETNNKYLVSGFIANHHLDTNYIISDFRFLNEYFDIKHALSKIYGEELKIIPIYIERTVEKNSLKFVSQPTLKSEFENYPDIKRISRVYQIPWETGLFWRKKLGNYNFNL